MAYSQSELDNPRFRRAQYSPVGGRGHRGVRIIEIGAVHHVEELSPEVERLGLGERAFVDRKYLHHGEVDIRHPRTDQQIPAGGPESAKTLLNLLGLLC